MKNSKFVLAVVSILLASVPFGSMAFAKLAKEEKHPAKDMPATEVVYECKKDDTVLTAKDEADCTHQGGKWEEKKSH